MVLLQAAVSRGPAFALLVLVESRRLTLLISKDVISELRDVLLRRAVYEKFPILTGDFVEIFLARLREMAVMIEPVPARFRFRRDPDDEPVSQLSNPRCCKLPGDARSRLAGSRWVETG